MTSKERQDFIACGLLIGSFVLAPFLMIPIIAPDYFKLMVLPPKDPVLVIMKVECIGDCPAPIGDYGAYFFDRSLIEWRGKVLRALPRQAHADNYGACPIFPDCIPSVEVLSKSKGKITVHLMWGGAFPRIFYPCKIVVE